MNTMEKMMYTIEQELHPVVAANYSKWGWPDGNMNNIKYTKLAGITNQTFSASHVEFSGDYSKSIIVKRFNDTTMVELIDRDIDNRVSEKLAELNLGPKVFCYDNYNRVEEFLPSEVLTAAEMPKLETKRKIMYHIAKFHTANIDFLPKTPLISDIAKGVNPL